MNDTQPRINIPHVVVHKKAKKIVVSGNGGWPVGRRRQQLRYAAEHKWERKVAAREPKEAHERGGPRCVHTAVAAAAVGEPCSTGVVPVWFEIRARSLLLEDKKSLALGKRGKSAGRHKKSRFPELFGWCMFLSAARVRRRGNAIGKRLFGRGKVNKCCCTMVGGRYGGKLCHRKCVRLDVYHDGPHVNRAHPYPSGEIRRGGPKRKKEKDKREKKSQPFVAGAVPRKRKPARQL